LTVRMTALDSVAMLEDVRKTFAGQSCAEGREVRIDAHAEPVAFESDRTLLRRVLGNMLKNALEATDAGHTVTLGCDRSKDELRLWVHNPTDMPEDVRRQVFQRSFTTKGAGRGLGTYSMKLLAEHYLNGRVSFTGAPEDGTTFMAFLPLTP